MAAQDLFDALAGATGHGIDRNGLNSAVATAQDLNGLRSQQTQLAMIKGQQAVDEQSARAQLHDVFRTSFGPGHEADADLASTSMLAGFGNAKEALDATLARQKYGNIDTLSDPNKIGTGQQTAAAQGVEGKLLPFTSVPGNYVVNAGANPGPVQQDPTAIAQTAAIRALGNLNQTKADAGGFAPKAAGHTLDPVMASEVAEYIRQNPNLAGNMRSLLANGGPDVIHAFLHPDGTSIGTPANGISPAPGVSLKEQADIRNDFAKGVGAKQTTSLNTMVQHSQLFDAIADQLGNGSFAPTNYINQLWQKTFGSPAPSNLQTAAGFLGNEAVRATVNSGAGTGDERELKVNANSSPEALHGVASTLRSLAQGQLNSLDLRARRGGVDIAQLLGPEAQAVFGRRPINSGPATAAPPATGKLVSSTGDELTPVN